MNMILFFLILLIVLSTLTLTYILYKKNYIRELNLRLSPIHEDCKKTIDIKKTIWIIGDSRIAQWEIPDSIFNKLNYCNLGIDGQTSAQVYYRFKDYLSNFNSYPKYVFIEVGINDLKAIGLFPKRENEITENCIKNIKLILREAIRHNIVPIYVSIILPGNPEILRKLIWSDKISLSVHKVNSAIKQFTQSNNTLFFEINTFLSSNNKTIEKEYQRDCLHLNKYGYRILNNELVLFNKKYEIK